MKVSDGIALVREGSTIEAVVSSGLKSGPSVEPASVLEVSDALSTRASSIGGEVDPGVGPTCVTSVTSAVGLRTVVSTASNDVMVGKSAAVSRSVDETTTLPATRLVRVGISRLNVGTTLGLSVGRAKVEVSGAVVVGASVAMVELATSTPSFRLMVGKVRELSTVAVVEDSVSDGCCITVLRAADVSLTGDTLVVWAARKLLNQSARSKDEELVAIVG